ncbi:FAD-binding and (Fe-S)-binding domain-containing protein [Ramlibacter sp. WS9]|uniref:D-2-hydroxyglutarate dehydrogenase YdiJ n=1 Tax=Ramlibacter sp. WS9 TaxID=1882741 RepID=UPI001143F23F|nr:FAD-binding and (Fe-S)-binding domain-containing protein [Ramlibacter sp. WS9]ROZ78122.1 FAD-binding oxidoreductase [Ramlibacter sp. WS9]HSV36713.1 FAD-binding and (Fe-S)-binding domain-containing protein [Ramlibacter sp.]
MTATPLRGGAAAPPTARRAIAIARIPFDAPASASTQAFLRELTDAGFSGEAGAGAGDRVVLATDNSIYQRLPQAVVYPRHADDVACLARLLAEPRHRRISVAPRGGGTGTNGQALTDGIVVDLSRHMNRIIEIDHVNRRARVQAGVVKDQLNAALRPHGLFFAPELSTSNRATIGGMVATDASGQGSCTYGKTRDHVLALEVVLRGGERLRSEPVDAPALRTLCERQDRIGDVYRTAERIAREEAGMIAARFPRLNRCLTGYDLAHLERPDGRFDLNSVLCGSEGTLAFTVEATLNLLPLPRHSMLVNLRYASFMDALRDAQALMAHRPLSIETVDSKVLTLARGDIVWPPIAEFFPRADAQEAMGINLVEFAGEDEALLLRQVDAFCAALAAEGCTTRLGHTIAKSAAAVEQIYGMRKRAVGLLGNTLGEARPQPFVEDTAVPPEHLAEYIAEFRALLDSHGVAYGMFGHVDAGVLHVRPALDMKDPQQAALVRPISDSVAALTRKYGGLLWGEHGKGVRSEYVPEVFGPLYPALQALKAAFDPYDQLNPGKIAVTADSRDKQLLRIDGVPLRGEYDRQIEARIWQSFGNAMHCNGNGACYNFDPDDAMCPSWKATRQREQSPKGRATLMREWLRRQGLAGVNVLDATLRPPRWWRTFALRCQELVRPGPARDDFSHVVYEAMSGCLACKSCAGQCPVRVDIPDVRARFLELYHQRYRRPIKDYAVGMLEQAAPYMGRMAGVSNAVMGSRVGRWAQARIGLVDAPTLSGFSIGPVLRRWGVETAQPQVLGRLSEAQRKQSVILVPDAFTRYFDTEVFGALVELAGLLGMRVFMAPYLPNGKPLQVHGFRQHFERVAGRNAAALGAIASFGVPMVGLDPAVTLTYRQEYRKLGGAASDLQVMLPQEWLASVALPATVRKEPDATGLREFVLLPHCTERTTAPQATALWTEVCSRFGVALATGVAGCCGMAGTYGHERRHRATSEAIFGSSWGRLLAQPGKSDSAHREVLATGYSCRCQTRRFAQQSLRHPVQLLVEVLRDQKL